MGLMALTMKGIGGSHCGVDGLDHKGIGGSHCGVGGLDHKGDRRKPLWG